MKNYSNETTTQRLSELIADGESAKQEFKSTLRFNLHSQKNDDVLTYACIKTIAAFLNSEGGGRLLIGVADDGRLVGIEKDNFPSTDKFSRHVFNYLKQSLGESATTDVTVEFLPSTESKTVCLITCAPSLAPVFCRLRGGEEEHFYVRIGSSSTRLTHAEFMKYLAKRFLTGMGEPMPFHLSPKTTVITEPSGEHEQLFESFVSVYEDLFPDRLLRVDPTVVADWLEKELYNADSATWPELLIVSHVGEEVTGFVHLNYHRTIPFAYGAYLGLAKKWRRFTSMRWLVIQAEEELLRLQPDCRGVFFDVDPIDLALIERWAGSKGAHDIANDVIVEQSRRLRRIILFQNMGAALLQNDRGCTLPITHPSLAEPLVEENERSGLIMFLPKKGVDFPAIDVSFLDMYYDLAKAGFGPSGINIPGYRTYLEDVVARQKAKINSRLNFGKLYLTPAMRRMLREIKAGL